MLVCDLCASDCFGPKIYSSRQRVPAGAILGARLRCYLGRPTDPLENFHPNFRCVVLKSMGMEVAPWREGPRKYPTMDPIYHSYSTLYLA